MWGVPIWRLAVYAIGAIGMIVCIILMIKEKDDA